MTPVIRLLIDAFKMELHMYMYVCILELILTHTTLHASGKYIKTGDFRDQARLFRGVVRC